MSNAPGNHFSTGSAEYAAHRPRYPLALASELARISPGHTLALDCACGTGQLSTLLARHFDAVVATDASPSQIERRAVHELGMQPPALEQVVFWEEIP